MTWPADHGPVLWHQASDTYHWRGAEAHSASGTRPLTLTTEGGQRHILPLAPGLWHLPLKGGRGTFCLWHQASDTYHWRGAEAHSASGTRPLTPTTEGGQRHILPLAPGLWHLPLKGGRGAFCLWHQASDTYHWRGAEAHSASGTRPLTPTTEGGQRHILPLAPGLWHLPLKGGRGRMSGTRPLTPTTEGGRGTFCLWHQASDTYHWRGAEAHSASDTYHWRGAEAHSASGEQHHHKGQNSQPPVEIPGQ